MNWSDEGIVLSTRKHGENSLIVTLMTVSHGSHVGLIRGGARERARGIYEPGNFVIANWRARIEEHLGNYSCELVVANAALVLNNALKLAGLSSACALTECVLPEREPHPQCYWGLKNLIATLTTNDWMMRYVAWEMCILTELGFGLDLNSCAATGSTEQLIYVSPKSGRAVSKAAGERYHEKMLPLPAFLLPNDSTSGLPSPKELLAGLYLTGHFLKHHVFIQGNNVEPAARTRLIDRLKQLTTISCD